MRIYALAIAFLLSVGGHANSNTISKASSIIKTIELSPLEKESLNGDSFTVKNKKLKAVMLAIFLGHFGVHRIYLGTTASVPVFYSLTLGGGLGLLPLIDTIAILKTKDIEQFVDSDKVFMWNGIK